jgi:hypothetical protein
MSRFSHHPRGIKHKARHTTVAQVSRIYEVNDLHVFPLFWRLPCSHGKLFSVFPATAPNSVAAPNIAHSTMYTMTTAPRKHRRDKHASKLPICQKSAHFVVKKTSNQHRRSDHRPNNYSSGGT